MTLAIYLKEIDATPLLTAEEERELARRIAAGDAAARDHLARANLRLVVSIARTFRRSLMPIEDLVSVGNLGLLRAVERFDLSHGCRFSTIATYWIRRAILRAAKDEGGPVRVPIWAHDLSRPWREAVATLRADSGHEPSDAAIAEHMGIGRKTAGLVRQAVTVLGFGTIPLDPAGHESSPSAGSKFADDVAFALSIVEGLPRRERSVIRARFGLDCERRATLAEAGAAIGISREHARLVEASALGMIRERMRPVEERTVAR